MKRNLINLLGIILMGIGKGKEDSEGKRSFLSGGLTV